MFYKEIIKRGWMIDKLDGLFIFVYWVYDGFVFFKGFVGLKVNEILGGVGKGNDGWCL